MTAKKPKPGLLSFLADRNNLLILLIIVVIIAVALLILSSEPEEKILNISDINQNAEKYIGKEVNVIAYYDSDFNMIHEESSSQLQQSNYDPKKQMDVDLSNLNQTQVDNIQEGSEYLFTGKVVEGNLGNIVLEVSKFERHR
jgi:hypothetical protein